MAQQQTNTIAHDAAVAATTHLEEQLRLPPPYAELAQMIIEAAVEAALVMERRRILENGDN
jgi:hypothetical protein